MAYIDVIDESKHYKMGETIIKANEKINFSIEKGEVAVILGPSGAGKSTVLNILGGMDGCDEGKVVVDGTNIAAFSDKELTTYRRNDVGFVFQFYNLVPNLTAKENVELASQIVADAMEPETVLASVGLGERMDNFPAQLSGESSNGLLSRGPWLNALNYYYVMNQQVRWILKLGSKF